MKIEVGEHGEIILKEVFSGVCLETQEGNRMNICMRDNGFEYNFEEAKPSGATWLIKRFGEIKNVKEALNGSE